LNGNSIGLSCYVIEGITDLLPFSLALIDVDSPFGSKILIDWIAMFGNIVVNVGWKLVLVEK
jgi:hypothetical protein